MESKATRAHGAIIALLVFSSFFLTSPVALNAHTESNEEHITSFDVTARINTDASVNVSEKIIYHFPEDRHGIFREIPIKYQQSWGTQTVSLTNISVTNENGVAQEFETSKEGGNVRIKIGDPDTFVKGTHAYNISYTVDKVVGYFEKYDELYWNATGNEWPVPIELVVATVYFPKPLAESDIQNACYQGALGSVDTCSFELLRNGEKVEGVRFTTTNLDPFAGLSFASGFPKGIVYEPTQRDRIMTLVKDNWIIVLPFIALAVMWNIWSRYGKDPKGRGTIVPEYEVPDNLTPIEVSALMNQGAKSEALSSEIIYLAEKGYLKITRTEEKGFFGKSTDYILIRTKVADETLSAFDTELLNGLFATPSSSETGGIKISDLKNQFYKHIPTIKKGAIDSLVKKGYYPTDPSKVMMKYIGFGIVAFGLIWLLGGILSIISIISIIASGLIIIVFGTFMPKVTELGGIAREKVQGLKLYINVAEKDRINFHNAPEKSPELFEKLLPYAMVLGLEKQWSKQFEGILTTPPSWYSDPTGTAFNAMILSDSLSSFNTAAASNLSSAPGGSSGSGGGGFSGGGGGGGGGGSW